MAREFQRSDRVADAIQRSLANLIQNEIRDPRLGMVNINAVAVTRDLAYARVYITLVGEADDKPCEQAAEILNKAAPFLRTMLSKEMKMRTTPKLQFFYDQSTVRGQELSALIDKAVAEDQSHQGKMDGQHADPKES